ncbi:MAG: NnrU family protein [Rhizomicrobium sp.]
MSMLYAAAAVFLGIHLLIAGTRLRDAITATIGEGIYLALFSLASLGAIAWLCIAYNAAQASGANRALYDLGTGVRDAGIAVVLLAFLIGVPGLMMANPTSVKQEGAAAKDGTVRGILRVTRHPFLWGVALWAAFHLAANGDLASVVLFGTFFALALFGTVSIDAKRRRKLGAAWEGFAARTSNVPFAAILAGRNTFKAREYFDWRFVLALLIFAAVLFGHARVIGVSPFPNGWVPF